MVVLTLVSSMLYVMTNAFSIWMISSLISTIMNQGKITNINDSGVTVSLNKSFEGFIQLNDISWLKKI